MNQSVFTEWSSVNGYLFKATLPVSYYNRGNFNLYPVKIAFEERVFIFHIDAVGDHTIYFYTQLVGSVFEAKNYQFKFEFHGVDSKTSSTFMGQVIPIDETTDRNNHFGINFGMFKNKFVDANRKFKVTINIRNITE